ncbi:MAG TPA: lipoprotein [Pseudolabrys sp.]|nr:lipoprotein [Pseudolabrys sp.]
MLHVGARPLTLFAVFAVIAAALTLGGCGRKGPLDLPPSAAAPPPRAATPSATTAPFAAGTSGGQSSDKSAGVMRNGQAVAPKGPQKRIPLDVLLD